MAFTDRVDLYVGVHDNGQIEVRRTRVILEDGEKVGEKHHREVLEPGDSTTGFPPRVRAIAQVVWTPQLIAATEARKAEILRPVAASR